MFILASASPRRSELLGQLGLRFEVVASGLDEASLRAARPETLARRLAAAKAVDVAAWRQAGVVLAADTVVVHRGEVLGKPAGTGEARAMLAKLRGRRHRVITGVALLEAGRRRPRVEHVVTRVSMRDYDGWEVEASIERGEPFDKAGGYGIQDAGFQPVSSWEGCYCNVMGLPLWTVVAMLRQAGRAPDTTDLPARCSTCPLAPVPARI